MLTFEKALSRHALLARRVTADGVQAAERLYAGVTGTGVVVGHEYTMAVADTMPLDYAVLLATDDIAAAYATGCQLDAFEGQAPAPGHAARKVASQGWAQFRELADKAGHQDHGLGADMSDAWQVLRTVEELNPDPAKIRRIADLAGRMYAALRGAKAKRVPGIPEEIVGVHPGDHVARLLPQEYALLGTAATRSHFYRQLFDRQLLEYERTGTERKARGPLVLVVDESGSMRAELRGQKHVRDDWSKAAMTALTRIAWDDKRPVVVVHFSTAIKTQVLLPGDRAGAVRAQHTFLNGGTAIGPALQAGREEVGELAARGHRGADVVLISDGGDCTPDEYDLQELRRAGVRYVSIDDALGGLLKADVRLFSVAIDTPFSGSLKTRAAEYVHLSNTDMSSDAGVLKVAWAVL